MASVFLYFYHNIIILINKTEGTPEKDEEKINQGTINYNGKNDIPYSMLHTHLAENGISKKPNVFGDIVLSPEQQNQLISDGQGNSQAVLAGALPWPDAVMPYVIDSSFRKFEHHNVRRNCTFT